MTCCGPAKGWISGLKISSLTEHNREDRITLWRFESFFFFFVFVLKVKVEPNCELHSLEVPRTYVRFCWEQIMTEIMKVKIIYRIMNVLQTRALGIIVTPKALVIVFCPFLASQFRSLTAHLHRKKRNLYTKFHLSMTHQDGDSLKSEWERVVHFINK